MQPVVIKENLSEKVKKHFSSGASLKAYKNKMKELSDQNLTEEHILVDKEFNDYDNLITELAGTREELHEQLDKLLETLIQRAKSYSKQDLDKNLFSFNFVAESSGYDSVEDYTCVKYKELEAEDDYNWRQELSIQYKDLLDFYPEFNKLINIETQKQIKIKEQKDKESFEKELANLKQKYNMKE